MRKGPEATSQARHTGSSLAPLKPTPGLSILQSCAFLFYTDVWQHLLHCTSTHSHTQPS